MLFSDAVESACGTNSAAVGPFYCPLDRKVYIDLSFYRELDQQFGAPGDFAQAYVLAHEVGHHVQTLLGISERVKQVRQRAGEVESNQLSVLQELQADCFAGVWGHHAARKNLLDAGDVEEGLQAAASIGDDTIQRRGRGRVSPGVVDPRLVRAARRVAAARARRRARSTPATPSGRPLAERARSR